MKSLLLTGIIGVALLSSCAGTQNASVKQEQRKEFMSLKGDWQITSIDHDKGFSIKPFDEGVSSDCFVGSVWKLVPNNYTGSYTLNGGGDCPSFSQPIKFEVVNGTEFKFKKVYEGTKAKSNVVGYSLYLVNQTDNSFTLQQNVPFEGDVVKVNYNFQKTSSN